MVKVHVKIFIGFSMDGHANKERPELQRDLDDGTTIKQLLTELATEFGPSFQEEIYNPQIGKLQNIVMLLLNGSSLELPSGLETKLQDGDLLLIAPMLQGG